MVCGARKKPLCLYDRDLFCFALGDARVCRLPSRLFMITVIISISFDAKVVGNLFSILYDGNTALGISATVKI